MSDDIQDFARTDHLAYDVALSFAGENRPYVDEVANRLKELKINVFYDKFEDTEFWGKVLYGYLDEVYRKRARFCVIFISKEYGAKLWTNHERRSAQAKAFAQSQEYILPVRSE